MKTIEFNDDAIGHAHGWDPDGVRLSFTITDISDVTSLSTVLVLVRGSPLICATNIMGTDFFDMELWQTCRKWCNTHLHCDKCTSNTMLFNSKCD